MHTARTIRNKPFDRFIENAGLGPTALRQAITAASRIPEPEAVGKLLDGARLPAGMARGAHDLAIRIAQTLRARKSSSGRAGLVQNLLQEYSLSSEEGVALMCLAEALLRIPDAATRDALIRDKISKGQWRSHLGKSPSLFVNAATWGMLITGKLVATHSESGLSTSIGKLVNLGGEPLIRKGVDMAMRMMGEQFVTGENIGEALKNAGIRESEGFSYSFDMLGEAAMTAPDAARYLQEYEGAIHAIGAASAGRGVFEGPGISIKLSALHPRYSRAQYDRVMSELYPVLVRLCRQAKRYDIALNIDAEEADRQEISLDLLERLSFEPQLTGWAGLGFVIQAYQKRCPLVIDYVVDLARRSNRRLMIRLVKGAYWDAEIKRAQIDGQHGYPVYTRKTYTDAAYIACARKLLAVPDAIYPQFATHNAHTLATIYELANPQEYKPGQYEFQCLHGMGEPLYEQVVGNPKDGKLGRPCRIYAPVGAHETLLAYLVRRLLENGANTSFVNRIADPQVSLEELVQDPVDAIEALAKIDKCVGLPHPSISLPSALYGPTRVNSRGLDLSDEDTLQWLQRAFRDSVEDPLNIGPMLAIDTTSGHAQPITNPSCNEDIVGTVRDTTTEALELALHASTLGAPAWAERTPVQRARILDKAADLLEAEMPRLMALLIREAGKTAANAVSEVREAVDFLRYYGRQVREQFNNETHRPLGPVVCISPWNFPLAIFLGQIGAALAAGNVVLAKPAEQTPLIAAEGVKALWQAGVPRNAVQLLPGPGAVVGAALVSDRRVRGVMFTGSTEVARSLQRSLVGRVGETGRAIPLIAETGGQNAMIVDTSALAEQVIGDVLVSAFDSAGQRCSALRVLCVQVEVADRVLDMLLGAMAELRVGNTDQLATDVGPVIDREARDVIELHIASMRGKGHRVHQVARQCDEDSAGGTFVIPTVIEIDNVQEIGREVFGPVLHFVRYKREQLDVLLNQIAETGYGLTMGLHTRIDETIDHVVDSAHVGNLYVNRNMVGAVVGVQPFGGEGLSGTGPKAGGPLYLYRLLSARPDDLLVRGILQAVAQPDSATAHRRSDSMNALTLWVRAQGSSLAECCVRYLEQIWVHDAVELVGPTGERNIYGLAPRQRVLCLAGNDSDRLTQLAAVLAVGSRAIWPLESESLLRKLPAQVQSRVALATVWSDVNLYFDGVLLHGTEADLARVQSALSDREGPVISVERLSPGETSIPLERLVVERALSINTAAAGGNASLMTIG